MSKYHTLKDHLLSKPPDRWTAYFSEVEVILGGPLPASAYKHTAWWSNELEGSHVQKRGWTEAGYRTSEVDLAQRKVTFVRQD